MTSTNVNQGLSDDNRASSRVLRPPGGGHTDIFGIDETQTSPKSMKKVPQSEIQNIIQPKGQNDNKKTDNGDEEKKEIPSANQRVRVPPGGFSSGAFW